MAIKDQKTTTSAHLLVCLGEIDPNALHHGPREAHRAGITSEARSQVYTAHARVAGVVFALERSKNSVCKPQKEHTLKWPFLSLHKLVESLNYPFFGG